MMLSKMSKFLILSVRCYVVLLFVGLWLPESMQIVYNTYTVSQSLRNVKIWETQEEALGHVCGDSGSLSVFSNDSSPNKEK